MNTSPVVKLVEGLNEAIASVAARSNVGVDDILEALAIVSLVHAQKTKNNLLAQMFDSVSESLDPQPISPKS